MFNTPVLFLIFNRPELTKQVFKVIRKIKPRYFYIAADGTRTEEEREICEQTRKLVLDNIDWECEVKTLLRDKNLGCKYAVSSAVDWFFDNVEEGIIVEDDCLPNKSFFRYCENLLEKYRDNLRIMHIAGANVIRQKFDKDSYYFNRIMHCWGWASWRRAWKHYDVEMENFDANVVKQLSDNPTIQNYWYEVFNETKNNKIDTWDLQWWYAILKNNGLCANTNNNLVKNLGFAADALHTRDVTSPLSRIPTQKIWKIKHPKKVEINYDSMETLFSDTLKIIPSRYRSNNIYRSAKKFNYVILSLFLFILIGDAIIWKIYLNYPQDITRGGMARLSYQYQYSIPKKTQFTLPKKHIEYSDYNGEKIDILTIGDSFSNGAVGGENPYYQDYIASNTNMNVLNLHLFTKTLEEYDSPRQILSNLINNGFIDEIKPKYIILETVERSVCAYKPVNMDETMDLNWFKGLYLNYKKEKQQFDTERFFSSGFYFLLYNVLYKFTDKPEGLKVYIKDLNKPVFTGKYPDKLLFYEDDVKNIPKNSTENISRVNNELNKLAEKLQEKNITLIFLPAPDKYNIYSEYVVDNEYDKSTFFQALNPLDKKYKYLNTKKILRKELKNGKKDLYYLDDSHWGVNGTKAIADELCRSIIKQ